MEYQRRHEEQRLRILQQEEQAQLQEQAEIAQIRHMLSQAFLNDALSEHSYRSAEQYEQDEQRHEELEAANNPGQSDVPFSRSPSPSRLLFPPGSSVPESIPPHESPPPGSPPLPNSPPPGSPPSSPPGSPPPPPPLAVFPPAGRPYHEPIEHHNLGPMTVHCPHCHALHFMVERLTRSSLRNPHFGMCCLQGQVDLPRIQPWPPVLQNLYSD